MAVLNYRYKYRDYNKGFYKSDLTSKYKKTKKKQKMLHDSFGKS